MNPHLDPRDLLARLPGPEGQRSIQAARLRQLELKLYAPAGEDLQTPHDRDEFYIVLSGSGVFERDGGRAPFKAGDLLFVEKQTAHRFVEFTEDFATWVLFLD
ncbi:MAG TPA: cupin domain-containing protein [Holophagaceae bacterium]|nr:cupin domain-containing protein [Holophagaceae bacterium]